MERKEKKGESCENPDNNKVNRRWKEKKRKIRGEPYENHDNYKDKDKTERKNKLAPFFL